MLDYEGELTVVIGKDAKNVSEADALSYVLGYTVGNDVSARNFQLPDASGGQVRLSDLRHLAHTDANPLITVLLRKVL